MKYRRKLIEVALPLESISAEAAQEKFLRAGHPGMLHPWWSPKPLVAWFEPHGCEAGPYGIAETLESKKTGLDGLVQTGILETPAGEALLLRLDESAQDWDPQKDQLGNILKCVYRESWHRVDRY